MSGAPAHVTTTCLGCGIKVSAANYGRHRNGSRCRVMTVVKQRAEKGQDFVERPLDQVLARANIAFEADLATYRKGTDGDCEPVIGAGFYAEAGLIAHVKLVMKLSEECHMSMGFMPELETRLIVAGKTDLEFRKAFRVLAQMQLDKIKTIEGAFDFEVEDTRSARMARLWSAKRAGLNAAIDIVDRWKHDT